MGCFYGKFSPGQVQAPDSKGLKGYHFFLWFKILPWGDYIPKYQSRGPLSLRGVSTWWWVRLTADFAWF